MTSFSVFISVNSDRESFGCDVERRFENVKRCLRRGPSERVRWCEERDRERVLFGGRVCVGGSGFRAEYGGGRIAIVCYDK